MLHKLTNKGFRGFTLIELLVVIAIIGLLSTVIAAPITEARKKGRDAKKIADLRSINTALQLYADDNAGQYPTSTLATTLVPRYLSTLPTNLSANAVARDRYMYVYYTDGTGRSVGYHLGVKLESPNPALNDDKDCGGPTDCVDPSVGATTANPVTVGTGNASQNASGGAPANGDFGGGVDNGTTQCTSALTNCVYDLAN